MIVVVIVAIVFVLIPTLVFAIVVMIVIAPTATVAVAIPVPVMVVFKSASRTIPISSIVAATFIMRNDPNRAFIRTPRPVAPVPQVTSAHRIPVAFDPVVFRFRSRARRPYHIRPRRWRRSNLNADGHLTLCAWRSSENRSRQHHRPHTQFPIEFHVRSSVHRVATTTRGRIQLF
jgi:hypothetical protein